MNGEIKKLMKSISIILVCSIAFGMLILFSGCGFINSEDNGTEQITEQDREAGSAFAVNTTPVVEGEILDYLALHGDVVAGTSVDAYPDAAGKLINISISVGSRVEKDQIIAEVDPSRPGQTFVSSPVKAPISGVVVSVTGQESSTVNQSTPIAKISKIDQLEVRTFVAERFVSKMRTGLNAVIQFDAFPEEEFLARVRELSPAIDPVSRTMEVKLDFRRRYPQIKPGMFAKIRIITERKENVVKIPAEGIVSRFGTDYVFVVQHEQEQDYKYVEQREVKVGIRVDNKAEIVEGLQADEEIVVRGQTLLEEGSRVNIIQRVRLLPAQE